MSMEIRELAVRDSFLVTPKVLRDKRGSFAEICKADELEDAIGRPFRLAQMNYSVSQRGTVRGIHGVLIPPGQAKFVTCVRGAVRDFVVDIRLDSPTFGMFASSVLDTESEQAMFVAEGLGHGFVALTDDACVSYLCSTSYVPGTPFEIDPFDRTLDLPWDLTEEPLISDKDRMAPSLSDAAAAGLLSSYQECLDYYAGLRSEVSGAPRGRPG